MASNIFKIIGVIALCLIIQSCDIMDSQKLAVYNNSKDTIFCLSGIDINNFSDFIYSPYEQAKQYNGRDTILVTSNTTFFPYGSASLATYNWKHAIETSKNKQIVFFFFKIKTLRENDWNELREKVICDKKIALTYEELEKLNWKVVYDGK